jgi:hypothetical protein
MTCLETDMKGFLFASSLLVLVLSASLCVGQSHGCWSSNGRLPGLRRPAPLSLADLDATDAPALFWRGYKHYWRAEYGAAVVYFEAATILVEEDARYWYYRALSERSLGESRAAQRSLARAIELHEAGKPRADRIGVVLERVQGPLRLWLRYGVERRPGLLDRFGTR